MTPTTYKKLLVGNGVTLSLVLVWWVCLALGGEAPTAVVKRTIDEVIRLVTDEQLKTSDQVSQRRELLEEEIGKHFDFGEMAKRSLAAHWKRRKEPDHQEFIGLFQALLSKTYAKKNRKLFWRNGQLSQGAVKGRVCRSANHHCFS